VIHNPYKNPFGGSPERRAGYEYRLTLDCILPLLESWDIDVRGKRVLDLGCGSGGLLVALAENGARGTGVDLKEERIIEAQRMARQHSVEVQFLAGDVLTMDCFEKPFDLVILSEVVEHLIYRSEVEALLFWCWKNLNFSGNVYVSFPPWFGPFAGHQAGWPGIRYIPETA
jgi:2-polyprenyl-3-methyl-5-hydroxy-6-metoxy-1,4-benzoquinol methylase